LAVPPSLEATEIVPCPLGTALQRDLPAEKAAFLLANCTDFPECGSLHGLFGVIFQHERSKKNFLKILAYHDDAVAAQKSRALATDDFQQARAATVLGASLLAGVVTAFCGPIAFIGVAVPHLARGVLRTSDHRILIPGVLLMGGIVALAAGLVAQLPGTDRTLPLNAVTSLIGAPVVVAILLRLRRASQAVSA
jgi:hypothetical protein